MNSKLLYQLAFQAIDLPASLVAGGRLVSEFRRACGDETEFRCWLLYEMSFALQGYFLTRHRPMRSAVAGWWRANWDCLEGTCVG